jgi:hypothetical protein
MAQNYTRQSSFADGDTITASLFNNEFNQVVNAFSYSASSDSSTGHKHDGTAGQGGNIPQIGDIDFLNKIVVDSTNNRWGIFVEVAGGPVEQVRIQDGAIVPVTTNDIDLGTSALQFKDIFIDGTANIDSLVLSSGSTVTTILDEDDLVSDSATALATQQSIKAYVDAQVTAQDLDIVGDTGTDAIDLDSETLTFTGGTGITSVVTAGTVTHNIDSTVATLTGTQTLTNKSLTAPTLTGTAIVASLDISGDIDVDGGTIKLDGNYPVGAGNVALGNTAFNSVTTGAQNVSIGNEAGYGITSGSSNTAVGTATLFANDTGSNNVAVGRDALVANTTASNNTAVGYQAAYSNTTGNNSVFVGLQAGYSHTTGAQNVAIGDRPMFSGAVSGSFNNAVGAFALRYLTSGSSNVAIGNEALQANTTASNNTAVGYQAGYSNDTGISNTFIGVQSGYSNTTGSYNTFVGPAGPLGAAGGAITTGSKNTIIGAYNGNQGGLDIRTASNHIVLSDGDGNPRAYWDAAGALTTAGAATFGGNVTGKNATFVTTTAASLISIGDTAAGTYSLLRMYGGSGKYNFQVGVQNNVNNAFEITPSTAVGGTTFTTPALLIDGTTGAATFSGSVALAGSSGGLLLNNSATADNTIQLNTTGGTTFVGANGSAGNRFIGSSAYAATFGTTQANALELATANTVRMTISSTGAATFGGTLSSGGITTTGNTSAGAASAGDGRLFPNNSYGAFVYGNGTIYDVALAQRSTGVALGVLAGTTNVVIPTGNLGIGTSSPVVRLNPVVSYVASTIIPAIKLATVGGYNSGSGAAIDFGQNQDTYPTWVTGRIASPRTGNNWGGSLTFSTNDNSAAAALVERMTLDASGNLGIGTDSPAYKTVISANGASGIEFAPAYSGTSNLVQHYSRSGGVYVDVVNEAAQHKFNIAGTTKMTLDASGNLVLSGNIVLPTAGSYILLGGSNPAVNAYIQESSSSIILGSANTPRMRIDTSGNVGIGVVPSAWTAGYRALEVGGFSLLNTNGDFSSTFIQSNAYYNGSWKYKTTGLASQFVQTSGFSTWSRAVSGTADAALTWIEDMRLDASGNLLVGCTSLPSSSVKGAGFTPTATGTDLYLGSNTTTGDNQIVFYNPNGLVGSISTSASVTQYNTSSDERLKENITDANDAGDKIDAIKVRQYDWKVDGSHQDYGMVAQELQAVAPEAVSVPEDPEQMMGVDYSKLVPMMLKEIQSLRARISQLEGAN